MSYPVPIPAPAWTGIGLCWDGLGWSGFACWAFLVDHTFAGLAWALLACLALLVWACLVGWAGLGLLGFADLDVAGLARTWLGNTWLAGRSCCKVVLRTKSTPNQYKSPCLRQGFLFIEKRLRN